MRLVLGALLLSVVSTACAPAPAALSQSDIEAIRSGSRTYVETALARDWPKWKTILDAETKFLPPNSPVLNGPDEAEKWGMAFPQLKSLVIEPIEIEGRGDTAWTRGRYSFVATIPGSGEFSDTGKYVEIWRRQSDGSWKIYRDIFNSDLPLPAPPPATAPPAPAKKN